MKKILLIEDDLKICEVIEKYFSNKGTEIFSVHNGSEALEIAGGCLGNYELVLLDIMLPDADGFTICREIRKNSDIPVIFITARAREEDILYGYGTGCDDYIIKPFLLSALYAKCDALIRRSAGKKLNSILKCGDIKLDTRRLVCSVNNNETELPKKEFEILKYLMEHQNCVIDRNTLLDKIWGYDYFGNDRVVDNHIKKLRKALGGAGGQIKTIIGRGYKLTER
ncbi:MAG: response regulator transcription factor [Ruminococcus sp.]|nr:response regulator transcription factor [Ruminococcus sp.]